MKIIAEIDVLQPLSRGTLVKLEGVNAWVEFKYERCPDFCYNCGIIGHGDKSCTGGRSEGQSSREGQYGAWMRVGNIMVSPLRAWKMTSIEVNQRGMAVSTVSKVPETSAGITTEKGLGLWLKQAVEGATRKVRIATRRKQ